MSSHRVRLAMVALAAALVGTNGCAPAERSAQPDRAGPAAAASSQRHAIRGVVVSVPAEGKSITLDHEEIPGVMHAMRMDLTVPDAADRERMKPGARFKATLVVDNNTMWVEGVEITGQGEAPPAETPASQTGPHGRSRSCYPTVFLLNWRRGNQARGGPGENVSPLCS